ncbi:MAG TPA: hypothetical protein VHD90_14160 [Phototrophicaceae bacterium]|nr:hypothetical protein [Phototrophicaceae bacterium]
MRKYRASNRVPFGGFILLILIAVIGGAILGGILWAVDDYVHFYLVIVFPLFAGAIAGALLRLGVTAGKVRSPLFALLMGFIAGLVMFGVYHYADYTITFLGILREPTVQTGGKVPSDADVDKLTKELFQDYHVSDSGFLGYLEYEANIGFSITNADYVNNDSDLNLTGNLVWAYWGIEILIAMITAGAIARGAANQPFDEESGDWYGSPSRLGITTTKNSKALTTALKDGNWQQAGSLLTTQGIGYPRHEVLLRRSRTPSAVPQQQDIYLTVNYAQRSNRTVVKSSGLVSPSELDLIQRSMQTQSIAAQR